MAHPAVPDYDGEVTGYAIQQAPSTAKEPSKMEHTGGGSGYGGSSHSSGVGSYGYGSSGHGYSGHGLSSSGELQQISELQIISKRPLYLSFEIVIKSQLSKLQKRLRWKRFHISTCILVQHCRCGYLAVITARQFVFKVSSVCTVAVYCSALNKSVEGLLLHLAFPASLAMTYYRQTFPLALLNCRIDYLVQKKKGRFSFLTAASVIHISKVSIFLL
jgi:hypothetical protein